MHPLAKLDQKFVWHPFTQMRDWLRHEPLVIIAGEGAVLRDVKGREYLDANSSIWTNLHGHQHPKISAAITRQLKKIAHSSALGFANEPASLLAARLVKAANGIYDLRFTIYDSKGKTARKSEIINRKLEKVFYSDDGSTALEVALKLAYEFRRTVSILRREARRRQGGPLSSRHSGGRSPKVPSGGESTPHARLRQGPEKERGRFSCFESPSSFALLPCVRLRRKGIQNNRPAAQIPTN